MSTPRPARKRASNACKRCHSSKLKCDVTIHGIPCSRCTKEGSQCEVFPSKRNSFRRQTKISTPSLTPRDETAMTPYEQLLNQSEVVTESEECVVTSDSGLFDINYWLLGSNSSRAATSQSVYSAPPRSHKNNIVITSAGSFTNKEVPDIWIEQDGRPTVNKSSFTFIGESSPLAMILRRLQDSGHIPVGIIPREKESSYSSSYSPQSCSSVSSQPAEKLEGFIASYFSFVHPYYPIINRTWFCEEYTNGTIPSLLLNAVCFAASYHCDPSTIYKCGFASRQDAKDTLYRQTKKIFDDEQEHDILIVLQSVVLLSFYGGRPGKLWTSRTWMGVAISIAEDLGIHRSTRRSQLNELEQCQVRIIWWCIVLRDLMTSFALGRPPKICEQRCNTEPLMIDDFDIDQDPDNPLFGKRNPSCYHFLIEISKLNVWMDEILELRYDPLASPEPDLSRYHQKLLEWQNSLPECVDERKNDSDPSAIYLSMAYHHILIFIFRPRMVGSEMAETCSLDECVKSANEIASCVATLGIMRPLSIPQDIYPIIVMAIVILIQDYRRNNSKVSKLHLQICMMTIKQASENWDHIGWLLDFLEPMMKMDEKEHDLVSMNGTDSKSFVEDFDVLSSYFMSNSQLEH